MVGVRDFKYQMKTLAANSTYFDRDQWAAVHAAAESVGRNVCGIYRFTHRVTGAVYIGQAKDIAERIKQHARDAVSPRAKPSAWHKALRDAGGVAAFVIEVLERLPCDPVVLTERENHWLSEHGAGNSLLCLNTHPRAGVSPIGRPLPPVVYLRISEKLKGRPRPEWVKAKISATKLTPEGRARNSAANKGRQHTAEAKANMSAAQNRPEAVAMNSALRKGKPMNPATIAASKTPEARAKISAALRGRIISPEMRQRISATMTGVKHTSERVRNQRIGRKRFLATGKNPWIGRKHSPESRAKMRASRIKFLSTK